MNIDYPVISVTTEDYDKEFDGYVPENIYHYMLNNYKPQYTPLLLFFRESVVNLTEDNLLEFIKQDKQYCQDVYEMIIMMLSNPDFCRRNLRFL